MGSEMCIRDSRSAVEFVAPGELERDFQGFAHLGLKDLVFSRGNGCLLYTSDAADERSSVDLGGRRIIKKKNSVSTTRMWKHSAKHNNIMLSNTI